MTLETLNIIVSQQSEWEFIMVDGILAKVWLTVGTVDLWTNSGVIFQVFECIIGLDILTHMHSLTYEVRAIMMGMAKD